MPVSKQRKNQKKKSLSRTSRLKDDAKRLSKKLHKKALEDISVLTGVK
jgi:hypothetical protein